MLPAAKGSPVCDLQMRAVETGGGPGLACGFRGFGGQALFWTRGFHLPFLFSCFREHGQAQEMELCSLKQENKKTTRRPV